MNRFEDAISSAGKALINALPVMIGVILLVSLVDALVPKTAYIYLFSGGHFDSMMGAVLGSVMAGNPITSYVIGGEFLSQGISMMAITAFLVAWVTVGLVQIPAESMLLGKRFAIVRNITAFIFSIIIAIVTVSLVNL